MLGIPVPELCIDKKRPDWKLKLEKLNQTNKAAEASAETQPEGEDEEVRLNSDVFILL